MKQTKGLIELKKVEVEAEVEHRISIDFGEEMVMEEFKTNNSRIVVH